MKKLGFALAGLLSAITVHAQDPAAEAAAPPAEPVAAEAAAPVDAAPAPVEAAPAEATAAEATTTETVAVDTAAAEEAPADARTPWKFYAGYDYTHINFRINQSNPGSTTAPTLQQAFGGSSFTSNFNRLRGGLRVLDVVGIEGHVGFASDGGSDPGTVSVDHDYGLYLVPTGVLFDTVEVAAVVGYTWMNLSRGNASVDIDGVSYGLNVELPIRAFSESLPDIRVGGGVLLYHKTVEAQVFGAHFGVRYDFKI